MSYTLEMTGNQAWVVRSALRQEVRSMRRIIRNLEREGTPAVAMRNDLADVEKVLADLDMQVTGRVYEVAG